MPTNANRKERRAHLQKVQYSHLKNLTFEINNEKYTAKRKRIEENATNEEKMVEVQEIEIELWKKRLIKIDDIPPATAWSKTLKIKPKTVNIPLERVVR